MAIAHISGGTLANICARSIQTIPHASGQSPLAFIDVHTNATSSLEARQATAFKSATFGQIHTLADFWVASMPSFGAFINIYKFWANIWGQNVGN
jgi:hypothetical protein